MIMALRLLREAQKRGWTFKVDQGDDDGPVGPVYSAHHAWELVKDVTDTWVDFFDASGVRLGAAHLMAPGRNTCSDEETLVDYTCSGNEFETLCDALIEEVF